MHNFYLSKKKNAYFLQNNWFGFFLLLDRYLSMHYLQIFFHKNFPMHHTGLQLVIDKHTENQAKLCSKECGRSQTPTTYTNTVYSVHI